MNSLLKLATEAHGGVDRWNDLRSLKANLSVTGGIWHVKGKPDILKDIRIELPLHKERLVTHFVGQNKRFVFTPKQLPNIETPVQIITGDHDTGVLPVNGDYLHERLPHRKSDKIDGGHLPWADALNNTPRLSTGGMEATKACKRKRECRQDSVWKSEPLEQEISRKRSQSGH